MNIFQLALIVQKNFVVFFFLNLNCSEKDTELFACDHLSWSDQIWTFQNRKNPSDANKAGRIAQTYSVQVEQRTPLQDNTQLPSRSNYGYVSDTVTESGAQSPTTSGGDYSQRDYQHHQGVAFITSDSNSIPIRYPTSSPATASEGYSTQHATSSQNYAEPPPEHNYSLERNRPVSQLWHNPSFVSDTSEEPRHNTDNYQRYLWNQMRDSPQISTCTDNTYAEIEQRRNDSFRYAALSEV